MVSNGICSVVECCGMCSLSGLLIGIFSELVICSMILSSGVVCIGGSAFWSSAPRGEVMIGSEGAVIGGVVVRLGGARPSVAESSECRGVVGSFGPCIYSCGGDLFGVFGLCSACAVLDCSCIILGGWGWSESDDDGA